MTLLAPVVYPPITVNEQQLATIEGTTMKVVELVMAHQTHGWSPEELQFQFPHLSMAQVHAALTYYWDHKAALDAEIARRAAYAQQTREEAGPSPLAARLGARIRS